MTIDMGDDYRPKRGDLVYSNIDNRRIRTWLILRARKIRSKEHEHRYELWAARWWELEPEMRMRLYASACRAGGQSVIEFKRYPPKRKRARML